MVDPAPKLRGRELRRLLAPKLEERTGQRIKAQDRDFGYLAQSCGITEVAEVNQQALVDLIVESDWSTAKNPHVDTAHWIAARYRPLVGRSEAPNSLAVFRRVRLDDVLLIGGSGWALTPGRRMTCVFGEDELTIAEALVVSIPYTEIESIELHGGTEVSGGGFFGGGFGVQGALTGMAVVSVLNAMTASSKTYTLVEITTREGELFLFHEDTDPGWLRVALSYVFTYIRVSNRINAHRDPPKAVEDR